MISEKAFNLCENQFLGIEEVSKYNQEKVLKAFIDCEVSESHFLPTTGYGYNDRGRDKLDEVFAHIFGTEDALVRHNIVSGTHALTVALFGVLRPFDKVLFITGKPYDTLSDVINSGQKDDGSLSDFKIECDYIDYDEDMNRYKENIKNKLKTKYKLVYIQRSRGYTLRESLSIEKIKSIIEWVRTFSSDSIIMVDNCYGEFVEKLEPTQVGADLIVGSLIKNPGGAIAPTGGYIAGKKSLIEKCACRLTSPGIGKEIGASLGVNRELFMGIYNAPHVVSEAVKTAVFTAAVFELMGYKVFPKYNEGRCDIIQSVILENEKSMINFCKGIQAGSPVDSFVSPEPWDMPGYSDKVIMAAGTFTMGASVELSADGPLRPPYAVWVQGGINFHSAKIGILKAAQKVLKG